MKKILLIGGGGFIGSNISNRLNKLGHDVHVIGRSSSPKFPLDEKIKYYHNNNMLNISALFSNVHCIIDLAYATIPSVSYSKLSYDLLENVPLHLEFFEAAMKARVKRYIFVSSGGTVYGDHGDIKLDEKTVTKPISPYGITKLTLENYANMFYKQEKFPVIIVRPSNPYGRDQLNNQGQGFIAAVYQSINNNKPLNVYGPNGTIRDYIYIDDLIDAFVALLNHGNLGEIYNIGSSYGINNLDLVSIIAKLLNKEVPELYFHDIRAFDVSTNILNIEKINKETGWRPKYDIYTGLKETFGMKI